MHIHLNENPARHAACESSERVPYVSPKHLPQPADRQARPLPTALMYVALIILILVYLVTKINKSALRFVRIWHPDAQPTGCEIYVPENLREEYERLLVERQRRAHFVWFSPPDDARRP